MDGSKPDTSAQAPELSSRNHDDGPIAVSTGYDSQDRYDFSTQQQQQQEKLNRNHSGFTPILPYPPQYQHRPFAEPPGSGPDASTSRDTIRGKRTWVGWTIGLVIGVLCALGAGIGIGYAIGEHSSSSGNSPNGNNATNTTVTSGATGIAAFDCNPDNTYASPFGASFAQECYVSYKTNQSSYDNSSIDVKNFAGLTVYSFEQCMDECQQRNNQLQIGNAVGDRCEAVSYYANLTYSIPAWAGNCFIKNAKGIGKNWDSNSNASLTASGYLVTLS